MGFLSKVTVVAGREPAVSIVDDSVSAVVWNRLHLSLEHFME